MDFFAEKNNKLVDDDADANPIHTSDADIKDSTDPAALELNVNVIHPPFISFCKFILVSVLFQWIRI